ncbi:hypothetical protein EG240_04565 [Paenimyroides tangerinum]|uniref:Uncharacterized protein n=1 Tax=Paenimyroides tangerinum TaxID=2488728 RepID=A0A3P3WCS0_9FLAO|nr:hypothetical protein [Paenimyroides tangerinum]RRJ91836.1 hypothetical protein EG240_04565 [Paenimyroides tangerinum]
MNYHKLKLQYHENIVSVALKYEIDKEELRLFHNAHCAYLETIYGYFPQYIEYIYLPIDRYENYLKSTLSEFKLNAPKTFRKTEYGVVYQNKTQDKKIHYTIDIEKLHQNLFQINKNTTYLNNSRVDKVVEELFEKTELAIYPLLIRTNNYQQILEIKNQEEIAKRWQNDTFPKLEHYYDSIVFRQITELIDPFFKKPNNYLKEIFSNLFYTFYFLPIYRAYPNGIYNDSINLKIPSLNHPISLNIQFNLQEKLTRAGYILLKVTGEES